MKKFWIAIVVILASCSAVEKPDNLIEEETMVNILYDLSLMESMRSQNPNRLLRASNMQTYIYDKYKIDSLQFVKSNEYYASDPKEYQKIFQKVSDKIQAEIKIEENKTIKKHPAKKAQESDDQGVIN